MRAQQKCKRDCCFCIVMYDCDASVFLKVGKTLFNKFNIILKHKSWNKTM